MAEIKQIDELCSEARIRSQADGKFHFGEFPLADCFYAPVVMRFHCNWPSISEVSQQYMQTMLANSVIKSWCADARTAPLILPDFEIGTDRTG